MRCVHVRHHLSVVIGILALDLLRLRVVRRITSLQTGLVTPGCSPAPVPFAPGQTALALPASVACFHHDVVDHLLPGNQGFKHCSIADLCWPR